MKLLTVQRTDFAKVDKLLPHVSFTGDDKRVYFNVTDKQYKHFKEFLPVHAIFTLPKAPNNEQSKLRVMPKV